MTFEVEPRGEVCDLRAALALNGKIISEVWTYRWLA